MSSTDFQGLDLGAGLLVDTNLLVLLVVGSVNRDRIKDFKRTSKYTREDYELLREVLGRFSRLYTVAHVLAEVSNLTDLSGPEKQRAREILKQTISELHEVVMPSTHAARGTVYESLGLVDAAIVETALQNKCAVLTDDLDLYMWLSRKGLPVINFTYFRAQSF